MTNERRRGAEVQSSSAVVKLEHELEGLMYVSCALWVLSSRVIVLVQLKAPPSRVRSIVIDAHAAPLLLGLRL